MTEVGEIFDHKEGGYRLIVVGKHWALIQNDVEIIAQHYSSTNYAAAKEAGLMSARIFVPHFAELTQRRENG